MEEEVRFNGMGAEYAKYRPSYPEELLDMLFQECYSASYAPKAGETSFQPFLKVLNVFFEKYAKDGFLTMPNETRCYVGEV